MSRRPEPVTWRLKTGSIDQGHPAHTRHIVGGTDIRYAPHRGITFKVMPRCGAYLISVPPTICLVCAGCPWSILPVFNRQVTGSGFLNVCVESYIYSCPVVNYNFLQFRQVG